MSTLVTGGSGCIGAYVIRDLIAQGEEVVNYDADPGGGVLPQVLSSAGRDALTTVRGDILDGHHLLRTMKELGVERAIHLAALQIPASNANPPLAVQVNVGGLVNVLEAARLLNLRSVLWASSVAVFGPPQEYAGKSIPNNGHHRPQSVYGACKSLGEYLVEFYHREYHLNATGFRFTAVYGVGRERGRSSFTTEMVRKAVAGEPYEVPFADDIIDWQYVEDVSRLIVLAADAEGHSTRIFSTQGDLRPVREGVAYLKKLAPDARLTMVPGAFGIMWNCDTTPLRRELGFEPKYSMEDGLFKTFNLYRIAAGLPPLERKP